jgi:hypothetical protein
MPAYGGLSNEGQSMSAVRFENEIHWDGNTISVWATHVSFVKFRGVP